MRSRHARRPGLRSSLRDQDNQTLFDTTLMKARVPRGKRRAKALTIWLALDDNALDAIEMPESVSV